MGYIKYNTYINIYLPKIKFLKILKFKKMYYFVSNYF